jgi:hypothetical protein
MPIHKDNEIHYPGGSIRSPEWASIKAFMRARAGDRCEICSVKNHDYGFRRHDGTFVPAPYLDPQGPHWNGIVSINILTDEGSRRLFRIVCTVAHMDHGLTDHSASNLKFLCQKCHLSHDAKAHAESRRARKTSDEPKLI